MDMRKIAFSLIGVALLSSCSLQKRYSPESYAWALPEIKAFERLNVQPIPKKWSTVYREFQYTLVENLGSRHGAVMVVPIYEMLFSFPMPCWGMVSRQ